MECPAILEQWELREAGEWDPDNTRAEFWQQGSAFAAGEKPRQKVIEGPGALQEAGLKALGLGDLGGWPETRGEVEVLTLRLWVFHPG